MMTLDENSSFTTSAARMYAAISASLDLEPLSDRLSVSSTTAGRISVGQGFPDRVNEGWVIGREINSSANEI